MADTPDDHLLEQLSLGNVAAVAELFAAYGPYLRAVVRGHVSTRLRAKFDSADVVQSVWVQVIHKLRENEWHPGTEAEIRAMLTTIARRRVLNRVRHHAPAADHERPLDETAPAAAQPRPSEEIRAGDLWEQMTRFCPPEHLEILRLRREGHTPAEIAERTGLHPGSVRRILRQLARDLADSGIVPTPDAQGGHETDASQ